jgi:mersacidin/lichenicidin family type 2 lantibiotic
MEGTARIPQEVPPPIFNLDVVRAWKDARYRRSLSAEQLQWLPGNPAGPTDLTDDEVKAASGLAFAAGIPLTTALTCTECSFHHWEACGCGPATTAINCTLDPTVCPCTPLGG